MKNKICILIMSLLLFLSSTVSAEAATVTAVSGGAENALFSNGYRGFCIDRWDAEAIEGVSFAITDTSKALNNDDNQDVSQKLKVLFTQCFDEIFVSDGDGNYTVKDTNFLLGVVWHFSDTEYVSGDRKNLVNKVNAYAGEYIPDEGYQIVSENGDVITFYFSVLIPQETPPETINKNAYQSYFAYKIDVRTSGDGHEHTPDNTWNGDETSHWHECECGEKFDIKEHTPTEATCTEKSICEICQKELGPVDGTNHKGGTEIINKLEATTEHAGYTGDIICSGCKEVLEYGEEIPKKHEHVPGDIWNNDETNHWHECECGEKFDIKEHTPTEATCTEKSTCKVCAKELGPVDEKAHKGETEVVGKIEATETKKGYTGDVICTSCKEIIEKGKDIPVKVKETETKEETETKTEVSEPQTEDSVNIMTLFVMMAVSFIVMIGMTSLSRKR